MEEQETSVYPCTRISLPESQGVSVFDGDGADALSLGLQEAK